MSKKCEQKLKELTSTDSNSILSTIEYVKQLMSVKDSNDIAKFQIWRINLPTNKQEQIYGLITDISNKNHKVVEIITLNMDPLQEEIAPDDIVVDANENILKERFIIEHWNTINIPINRLDSFIGNLESSIFHKKIEEHSNITNKKVYISPFNEMARELKIAYTKKLANEGTITLNSSYASLMNKQSIIKLLYKDIFGHSANKVSANAASFSIEPLKESLEKKGYKYGVRQLKGRSSFTLYSKKQKPFEIEVTYKDKHKEILKSNEEYEIYFENGLENIQSLIIIEK